MNGPVCFELEAADTQTQARAGRLHTPHGTVVTPIFMPVGTQATVKGLTPDQLRECGSRMLLANTYHLELRPGSALIGAHGGLHRFMGWDGPILTDSGGFQVFSLAERRTLDERGVSFRSHIDGRLLELTPESAMHIQGELGADVAMCLDQCPALPAGKTEIAEATHRTIRWAERCKQAHTRPDQGLFGIVQGGTHADLRAECAERLIQLDFSGYAIGGVSVGESRAEMEIALEVTTPRLPRERARYLMGVGRPHDLLVGIAHGIDMFDCVLPTRNGRNATCLAWGGSVKLRNAVHRHDDRPIEDGCPCLACRRFSRAYLRHLFLADEMLGPILASLHNLTFVHQIMASARTAIESGTYGRFMAETLEKLGP